MRKNIRFRTVKNVSASAVRALFRRNQWYDWFSVKDVEWYLRHALFIASAWHGRQAVGLAVLTGDGRISIELDTLIVDKNLRGKGIGKTLIEMVVAKAEHLGPYYFKVEVFEKRTENLYAKLGFQPNKGTWLLGHKGTADALRYKVKRLREMHR